MKKFDILYKRTKTGSIQYWKIKVRDSDFLDGGSQIRKESGQLGTDKPLVHVEAIHQGKQKRSPLEQAEFMAESDWKKKKDSGYKTLQQLEDFAKERGIL